MKDNYPNATKLREATTNYNCHSYAWHLQTLPNVFWINDPSPYMTDGSWIVRRGDKQIQIRKGLPQSLKGYDTIGYSLFSCGNYRIN